MFTSRVPARSVRRRGMIAALLGVLVVAALVLAGGTSARSQADPIKAAWIYVGPTTTAAGRRPTTTAGSTSRRSSVRRCRRPTRRTSPPGPKLAQTVASLVRDGNKIIFATSFGMIDKKLAAKYPDVYFEQATGTDLSKNLAEYFGAGEDTIYLSGMAAGAATKNGKIGYIVPFAIPEVIRHANAFALGAQAVQPEGQGQADLDELMVRPGQGEEGGREPRRLLGRRRARPERRQPGCRPVREVEGHRVGRLRQQREQVRGVVLADGGRLRLGPVLPEPREGGDGRDVEVGLLLRQHQGRLHRSRAVRAEGDGEDEGDDRGQEGGDREREVQRLLGPALRPERQAEGAEGHDVEGPARPLRDELARQGHRGSVPKS